MRTYLFLPILASFFSLAGCNQDDTPNSDYPAWIYLYFDFVDTDGKKLPESYVEIVNAQLDHNGNLIPFGNEFEWLPVGLSSMKEDTFFGPMIVGGNVEETIEYKEQSLKRDYYYLYRFSESDIDTLRVHSTSIVTEQNHVMQGGIAVFYNGELVTSYKWLPDTGNTTSGIYYFDDNEVVSTQAHRYPWILKIIKGN
ncbi:hypothetical protein LZF95_20300 [Algoriphagus sp. AGSA1]|uniref:hypothetical protein n=1 Tax=Algoriphagus sp. AGSA1 TaxID=2907213 RepID=UPI001F2C51FC|nr:hypothetical protein [Algoriphagus sp. AGSA1]MCE7057033.1 hypothetical protein [Algoriphagus sp. AGSA1]